MDLGVCCSLLPHCDEPGRKPQTLPFSCFSGSACLPSQRGRQRRKEDTCISSNKSFWCKRGQGEDCVPLPCTVGRDGPSFPSLQSPSHIPKYGSPFWVEIVSCVPRFYRIVFLVFLLTVFSSVVAAYLPEWVETNLMTYMNIQQFQVLVSMHTYIHVCITYKRTLTNLKYCKVNGVIPILYMSKLRLRELK